MLHQFLLALLGKQGAIFKADQFGFQVDPNVDFLSDAQRQVINQIVQLGYYYFKMLKRLKSQFSYNRELAKSLRDCLSLYQEAVLQIQTKYLQSSLFTFNGIKSDLFQYFSTLPLLSTLLDRIDAQALKGGQIIRLVHFQLKKSGVLMENILQNVLDNLYRILFTQLKNWILFGELTDRFEEFFIHRVINDEKQASWDNQFTIRLQMLPLPFVDKQLGEKIMFIGKGMRIIKSLQGKPQIVANETVLNLVSSLERYDSLTFRMSIQQLRKEVAHYLLTMILQKHNLLKVLKRLQEFFFMSRGEFYLHLLQQSQDIFQTPYDRTAQIRLNQGPLQHTLAYFGMTDSASNLTLQIKPNGFHYQKFSDTSDFLIAGNVKKTVNEYLTMIPDGQPNWVWSANKHSTQNGFKGQFDFRIKQRTKDSKPTTLQMVLQNKIDISSYNKIELSSMKQIQQYISLRLTLNSGVLGEGSLNADLSLIISSKLGQRQLGFKKIIFSLQKLHSIRYLYENDNEFFTATFDDQDQSSIRIKLKLQKNISLDAGKSHVALVTCSHSLVVDIMSWRFVGNNLQVMTDEWAGLTPVYKIEWPLSLLITQQMLQKYQNAFRLFFPVRKVLHQLQRSWCSLMKFSRQKNLTYREQVKTLMKLRIALHLVISNIWIYFQSQVVLLNWNQLQKRLKEVTDFEELRQLLQRYVTNVNAQCFLNIRSIIDSIHSIIKIGRTFIKLVQRWLGEPQNVSLVKNLETCHKEFVKTFGVLSNLIKLCGRQLNIKHLYQLLMRLDYNQFYKNLSP